MEKEEKMMWSATGRCQESVSLFDGEKEGKKERQVGQNGRIYTCGLCLRLESQHSPGGKKWSEVTSSLL